MKFLVPILLFLEAPLSAQTYFAMRAAFLERKGEVESMELVYAEESPLTTTYDFLLRSTSGDSISGRLRLPKGEGPFPAALLCVGIETGKEVIDMIEGQDSVALVAVNYPFEGALDFRGWSAWGTTFRLRSMAYRTVPLLLTCLDWMFERRTIDSRDVTVVSVSFGVFTGLPAAVIDQRVKQAVVVQAGGDLSGVIASNAERLDVPVPSWLAGWLGGAILAPFEPNKYVSYLMPRKLLMVCGKGDTMFPEESALSLYEEAREPKELIWHTSKHVMPGEKELIKELTNVVVGKLYGKN
ncbi:MAG: serine hydrolase family protein [Ignavibacteriae bacterium]|nr:serine hydrolase family protein [Ignavibacteriota bacterium]